MIFKSPKEQKAFESFARDFKLTAFQQEQFKTYITMLLVANENFNLTTIVDIANIINFHFRDSLHLAKVIDLTSYKGLADVGSGGGFPGIPLKILYPSLPVVLIEVTRKKINFLWDVINELHLDFIFVSELDWRTFLRKADFELDIFCARASLHTDELIRLFKPGCSYKHAQLIYWASAQWLPESYDKPFITQEIPYKVGNKSRKLVFFATKE